MGDKVLLIVVVVVVDACELGMVRCYIIEPLMGLTLAYTSASEVHCNMTFLINLHRKNPLFAWFRLHAIR